MNIAEEIIAGLNELADNLEAGVPIEATEVRRVETPDGPMHVQRWVVIPPTADIPQTRREGDGQARR